eukprot:g29885.t1
MKVIDEGRAADVVYMEFSKAFDKVPHGRLIQKIKIHGIHGDLAAWIQDWLAHRRQRVVVEGVFQARGWRLVVFRRDPLLGPLLFVIY